MLTRSRSGGWLLIVILVLGLLPGCWAPSQPQGASTPDTGQSPAPSPTPPNVLASPTVTPAGLAVSPGPSPGITASPSPSPVAASPTPVPLLVARGTGDEGLVLRREPDGERIGLIPEGQVVTDLGEARQVTGRDWRRVRAQDGTEGWVAAEFLAPAPAGDAAASTGAALATATAAPGPTAPPAPTVASAPSSSSGPGAPAGTTVLTGPAVGSPEYGLNVFLAGNAATTDRDLAVLNRIGFGWQKSLFQWRSIEGEGRGVFDWRDADRVVAASQRAEIKIIARLDFQPDWARADGANNGPPDDYGDYANFVRAFVERYKAGSPRGTVHAIEIWNEPNLDREWGGDPIDREQAADYVRLLRLAYEAAKQADPSVIVISGGLSPTCTDDEHARPDDVYLQWLYDAGAAPYFDVLGAHGAGYDKPPSASPDESAARHNGCRVFTFRRVEDLRAVMERNGDGGKQVWLLEFGWTTDTVHPAYAWFAIPPETHGEYIVDAYRWAREHWAPWIGVMALWNLPDPNWSRDREEYWWGIANPDGTPRPALDRILAARRDGSLP